MEVLKFTLIVGFAFVSLNLLALEIRIPLEKHRDSGHLKNMTRDSILFGISAFVDPKQKEIETGHETVFVSEKSVYPEALDAFVEMSEEEDYLGVMKRLRRLLTTGLYDSAEELRHPEFALPATQQELQKKMHYMKWPRQIVKKSVVKNRTRILYRNPDEKYPLSIAETHESQEGEVESPIRETEVILKRLDGTGWDFYVFDSTGKRTTESTFYNKMGHDIKAYSPYTCMTCHYDGANRQFQRLPLSFAGRDMLK